jgi:hypothetical protein
MKLIVHFPSVASLALRSGCAFTSVALLLATPSRAMTQAVSGGVLILSGEIVRADLDRAKEALDRHRNITHVVLRNSMGGNSWTGYRMGELFRERGLTTVVSGHCVSSCSRLFLGGKARMFSDDFPASLTYVGFHGHYDFGKLNREATTKNDLIGWTKKFTDGKVDPRLLDRWANIELRAGDVRFYRDRVAKRWKASTFLCRGTESRRPQHCERIATDALAQGIVTTVAPYSSPDAVTLLYGKRSAEHRTTTFAELEADEKLPTRNANARREYRQFLDAALPRAFALASDGSAFAWSANSSKSTDTALAQCASRARKACVLYAVDERVVFR